MSPGEWVVTVIVALGGGAGVGEFIRRVRGPAQRKSAPGATGAHAPPAVSHADLSSLKAEFQRAIDEVRRECESQSNELADRLVEKIHGLALRVERLVAAHEERYDQERRSRR